MWLTASAGNAIALMAVAPPILPNENSGSTVINEIIPRFPIQKGRAKILQVMVSYKRLRLCR